MKAKRILRQTHCKNCATAKIGGGGGGGLNCLDFLCRTKPSFL